MSVEIESLARIDLAKVLPNQPSADELMLDADMADEYGLTSLNKVLFLMSVCDDTGVSVSAFTEPDVAQMRTLADVVAALSKHAGSAA
jgi:acyl carrier protein